MVAGVLQGAAGFGFGLIALPASMAITASMDAVPLVIVLNLAVCAGLAVKLRGDVHFRLVVRLAGGALAGLPIGLLVFEMADPDQATVAVAVIVLAFLVLLASSGRGSEEPGDESHVRFRGASAIGVGAMAGAMAVSLGMPGPPVVLYMSGLAVKKDMLRATAVCFFAASYLAALVAQVAVVGVATDVWIAGAALVPVGLGGAWLGDRASAHVNEEVFRRATLLLVGITVGSTLIAALVTRDVP